MSYTHLAARIESNIRRYKLQLREAWESRHRHNLFGRMFRRALIRGLVADIREQRMRLANLRNR